MTRCPDTPERRVRDSSDEALVTIIWFTDKDREDMRNAQDERVFLDALACKHARVADSTPLTPEQLRAIDRLSLLQLDPRPRLDRRDD